jgi:hypothetical protein
MKATFDRQADRLAREPIPYTIYFIDAFGPIPFIYTKDRGRLAAM